MALISCPECQREISDAALSCPQCGYPINRPAKTEKKWIIIQAIGTSLVAIGAFLFYSTFFLSELTAINFAGIGGMLTVLAGICLWLFGSIGAWRHHG